VTGVRFAHAYKSGAVPRVLPFAVYLFFLALAEILAWVWPHFSAVTALGPWTHLWIYPLKTAAVLAVLVYFWPRYDELNDKKTVQRRDVLLAVVVGLVVYGLWVRMDWPWATQGRPGGYNPMLAGDHMGKVLVAVRLLGAVIVVPVMEELFWRSFLLRYLISPRFETVPLGTFTVFSFLATLVLFGLEHHLWLAGMTAGAAYTLLLYGTRRLWPSIIAHAVTNLALGIHVLFTQEWTWW
jgi:CAAX prenyl protease-like protein